MRWVGSGLRLVLPQVAKWWWTARVAADKSVEPHLKCVAAVAIPVHAIGARWVMHLGRSR